MNQTSINYPNLHGLSQYLQQLKCPIPFNGESSKEDVIRIFSWLIYLCDQKLLFDPSQYDFNRSFNVLKRYFRALNLNVMCLMKQSFISRQARRGLLKPLKNLVEKVIIIHGEEIFTKQLPDYLSAIQDLRLRSKRHSTKKAFKKALTEIQNRTFNRVAKKTLKKSSTRSPGVSRRSTSRRKSLSTLSKSRSKTPFKKVTSNAANKRKPMIVKPSANKKIKAYTSPAKSGVRKPKPRRLSYTPMVAKQLSMTNHFDRFKHQSNGISAAAFSVKVSNKNIFATPVISNRRSMTGVGASGIKWSTGNKTAPPNVIKNSFAELNSNNTTPSNVANLSTPFVLKGGQANDLYSDGENDGEMPDLFVEFKSLSTPETGTGFNMMNTRGLYNNTPMPIFPKRNRITKTNPEPQVTSLFASNEDQASLQGTLPRVTIVNASTASNDNRKLFPVTPAIGRDYDINRQGVPTRVAIRSKRTNANSHTTMDDEKSEANSATIFDQKYQQLLTEKLELQKKQILQEQQKQQKQHIQQMRNEFEQQILQLQTKLSEQQTNFNQNIRQELSRQKQNYEQLKLRNQLLTVKENEVNILQATVVEKDKSIDQLSQQVIQLTQNQQKMQETQSKINQKMEQQMRQVNTNRNSNFKTQSGSHSRSDKCANYTFVINNIDFEEHITSKTLSNLRVADLKNYLKENDLSQYGKKAILVKRVEDDYWQ